MSVGLNIFTGGVATTATTNIVDLEGVEPSSKQLISSHAKILVVNSMMISHRIRFKAILSHSDAFSTLLRAANPLKYIERLERLFLKP